MRIISIWLLALMLFSCKKTEDWQLFEPEFDVTVLLPEEGLGDRSFVDEVYGGVEACTGEFNFKAVYIVPESLEKGVEWIKSIASYHNGSSRPSLIILAGNQYTAGVDQLEGKFGKHKLLLLAGKAKVVPNLASLVYRSYAPSYLGGYLSAKRAGNCRALVIAAFEAPFLSEYQAGFSQGVLDAGGMIHPTVYLSTNFSGFSMADSAYIVAKAHLADNNLIFALASGSNLGIVNAARNYPQPRFVVGVDSDQSWMGLNVVTGSVVSLFRKDIRQYISQFSAGSFQAGHFFLTMENLKTAFLINQIVMGSTAIPQSLTETAIAKEKLYLQSVSNGN